MWKLLGKLVLLGVARRWARRPTAAIETAALALVLTEPRLGRGTKRDLLLTAAHVVFLPAAVIKVARLAKRVACGKRRGPMLGGPPLALPAAGALEPLAAAAADGGPPEGGGGGGGLCTGEAEEVAAPFPTFRHQPPPLPRLVPRAEWGLLQIPEVAPQYEAWVGCLRNVLAQQGYRSLPPDVDPDGLELTRYLLYGGLLAATKPAEAARAVAVTAARVTGTINWRATYGFMSESELKEWEDVTWWAGPDENGTLWLHLHLAQAMARCVRGEGHQCVQAVISQLEYGTRVTMVRAGGTGTAATAAPSAAASSGGAGAAAAGGSSGGGSGSLTPMSSSSYATVVAVAAEPEASATVAHGRACAGGGRGEGGAPTSTAAAAAAAVVVAAAAAAVGGVGRGGGQGASGPGRCGGRRRGGGGASTAAADIVRADDRIRVVVIGSGSNVRQALRMFPMFREFARLVQRHYPGRLRAMYLVDMPRGLRMSLGAVLNLLATETRQKVKIFKIEDLPEMIAAALIYREQQQQQRVQQEQRQHRELHQRDQHRLPLLHGSAAYHGGGSAPAAALDDPAEIVPEADPAAYSTSYGSGPRRLFGSLAALALALPAALVTSGSVHLGQHGSPASSWAQQVADLRRWLLRVVPALLMAAMACLTYKSILARP